MNGALIWWVLGACLVGLEMVTGTFYLLMLAIAAAAAALAAHAGLGALSQIGIASAVGVLAVACWHWVKAQSPAPQKEDEQTRLDIGQTVWVDQWGIHGQGTTVQYRGSRWQARLTNSSLDAKPGTHRIVSMDGNCLMPVPQSEESSRPLGK